MYSPIVLFASQFPELCTAGLYPHTHLLVMVVEVVTLTMKMQVERNHSKEEDASGEIHLQWMCVCVEGGGSSCV